MSISTPNQGGIQVTVVVSESGFGEMSFALEQKYSIRDRADQQKLETTIKGMTEVKSAEALGGWLKVKANVGALKGSDKTKALKKLHDKIEQTIIHKQQHRTKQLAAAAAATSH